MNLFKRKTPENKPDVMEFVRDAKNTIGTMFLNSPIEHPLHWATMDAFIAMSKLHNELTKENAR